MINVNNIFDGTSYTIFWHYMRQTSHNPTGVTDLTSGSLVYTVIRKKNVKATSI